MDGFQGAVLNVKLKYLDRWTARRQELARLYRERLEGSDVRIPQDGARCESAYHLFTVWVQNRDTVREELARKGVQTAVHYSVPVHLQKAYSHLGYKAGLLPHTERACAEVISRPLFPEMSREQVLHAAGTLGDVAEGCVRESAS